MATPNDRDHAATEDDARQRTGVAGRIFAEVAGLRVERPLTTYRLQVHAGFRLDAATGLLDYLDDLGITDLYLSPFLSARPGSTHGYDVFDHSRLNAEIGDQAAHDRLVAGLAGRGMRRVLDIVPNHMGIAGQNRFWLDLLELGKQSSSARFFDIDWQPVKAELAGRVLIPILGGQYGNVLESGAFRIECAGGVFTFHYGEWVLPIHPRSYSRLLDDRETSFLVDCDLGDWDMLELRSIRGAADELPDREATDVASLEHVRRETEVLKRRTERLIGESPRVGEFVERRLGYFRGKVGEPRSFNPLHELLEEQVYRLAFWRVASEEINYRRFFDINELAGLRTEDPSVFEAIHVQIIEWGVKGGVSGLRIDHPDGLADPRGYFCNLQRALFLSACRALVEGDAQGLAWKDVALPIREQYDAEIARDAKSELAGRFPIVAEKILTGDERLPENWPIDGTVGYEYLNALNGLFVDPASELAIDEAYRSFSGDRHTLEETIRECKGYVTGTSMASETNMLANRLSKIAEGNRHSRDFTLNQLTRALREVISAFGIYRTYIRPGEPISPTDRASMELAFSHARRREPSIDPSVFDFLESVLLLDPPADCSDAELRRRELFLGRFQQTTGPVEAKALEDTGFYRFVRLISLNEVGGDPEHFGRSAREFHDQNLHRLRDWPGGLSTTATHDTKRGEDARIRIDAISEFVAEWPARLARWSELNRSIKPEVNGKPVPDPIEEYLFYQTLIGAWPAGEPASPPTEEFASRVAAYMVKAAREAKRNTSWSDSDPAYCDALSEFVKNVLRGENTLRFLNDFSEFQGRIARVAIVHSLAQAALKIGSPGVPDVYQGCELWDFSMVDPDNRRPVNYEVRRKILGEIRASLDAGESREQLAQSLLEASDDGAVKLYLIWTLLNHRRSRRDLYERGDYRPIEVVGPHADRVLAFARTRENRAVVYITPRLVAPLMGDDARTLPVGSLWSGTKVILPSGAWTDLISDRCIAAQAEGDAFAVDLSDLFATFPLSVIESRA
ncbi:malto-oligosyltrehalose synthase [Isosphaeraceae bacterium EP7]